MTQSALSVILRGDYMLKHYKILDSKSGQLLDKTYRLRAQANRWIDKKNLEYGAYRYYVVLRPESAVLAQSGENGEEKDMLTSRQ